jgi:hypothetical protein
MLDIMSGHQSFQTLIKDFSPERVKKIAEKRQYLAQYRSIALWCIKLKNLLRLR